MNTKLYDFVLAFFSVVASSQIYPHFFSGYKGTTYFVTLFILYVKFSSKFSSKNHEQHKKLCDYKNQ